MEVQQTQSTPRQQGPYASNARQTNLTQSPPQNRDNFRIDRMIVKTLKETIAPAASFCWRVTQPTRTYITQKTIETAAWSMRTAAALLLSAMVGVKNFSFNYLGKLLKSENISDTEHAKALLLLTGILFIGIPLMAKVAAITTTHLLMAGFAIGSFYYLKHAFEGPAQHLQRQPI